MIKHKPNKISIPILLLSFWCSGFSQINDLAKTPPMGWNSWNIFHENIDENKIKEIADALVTSGMKDAGYVYLNLDDNWMANSRDVNGNLRADPTRFPSGMKALGDYIHSKGLKFGIYGDRGLRTCHHFNWGVANSQSGSYGNEVRDAKTFASWGVDYLKYDNCEPAPGSNQQQDYERMRDALANSGRPIVYSICAWGFQSWMPNTGNLWRTTGDISNSWQTPTGGFFQGVSNIFDLNEGFAEHAGPSGWNDPDMLQIGNGVLTADESRSHMSLWAIMAAPLIAGNDIRNMDQTTKDILMNPEVIAVNQDSAGIQGRRIDASNGVEVWSKPLGSKASTTLAIALLNRNDAATDITLNFADVNLSGEVLVRDLWARQDRGVFSDSYTMSVPAHGTGLLKIKIPTVPQEPYLSAISIPGKVEMEHYDLGGQGVSYFDNDPTNQGDELRSDAVDITTVTPSGYAIGWTNTDEWLEYTLNVGVTDKYFWRARVSTGVDTASFFMELNGVSIADEVRLENTGSWEDYIEVSGDVAVPMQSGENILKVIIGKPFINIDYIEFYTDTTVGLRHTIGASGTSGTFNTNNLYKVYNLQGEIISEVEARNLSTLNSFLEKQNVPSGVYLIQKHEKNQNHILYINQTGK